MVPQNLGLREVDMLRIARLTAPQVAKSELTSLIGAAPENSLVADVRTLIEAALAQKELYDRNTLDSVGINILVASEASSVNQAMAAFILNSNEYASARPNVENPHYRSGEEKFNAARVMIDILQQYLIANFRGKIEHALLTNIQA